MMNKQYSITNDADRSIFAPSPCGEGWGGASLRGHSLLLFSSRGDPPHWYGSRGRPMLMLNVRGHPPQRFCARGDLPENRNFRDGPLAEYAARGKPPELKPKRNNSVGDGLIFSILAGKIRPDGRGMPGREMKNYNADRSGDAVRFEKKQKQGIDLSACEAPGSVSKDELKEKYYGT